MLVEFHWAGCVCVLQQHAVHNMCHNFAANTLLSTQPSLLEQMPVLCRHFGASGPYWGREYLFWHEKRPLTVIEEVFSPRLQQFLGSQQ